MKILGVGFEDELKLLPLDLSVSVEVERVEGELHVVLIGHDGLVDAHGNELVVVDLAIAVRIYGANQVLQIA